MVNMPWNRTKTNQSLCIVKSVYIFATTKIWSDNYFNGRYGVGPEVSF